MNIINRKTRMSESGLLRRSAVVLAGVRYLPISQRLRLVVDVSSRLDFA